MPRLRCVLLVAVVTLGVTASPAAAISDKKLGSKLGALWQTVIETPTPENIFGPNGGDLCVDNGDFLAAFAPLLSAPTLTCTVKPGTKLLVPALTSECSTLEAPPYFGSNEAELRACARAVDAGITRTDITLDGKPVPVREVESGLLHLDLPADNIFGAAAGDTGELSVAHGWVAFLHPLTPGTHEITIHVEGIYVGNVLDFDNTTRIVVEPGL